MLHSLTLQSNTSLYLPIMLISVIPGARGWKVDYEGLDDSGELYDEIEKGKAEQSARKEDHKKARKQERKQIKELKKAQKEKGQSLVY